MTTDKNFLMLIVRQFIFIAACFFSSIAFSQDFSSQFTDWSKRFRADLENSSRSKDDERKNLFTKSVVEKSLSSEFLQHKHAEGKLFDPTSSRQSRIWSTGKSLHVLLHPQAYAGYGGRVNGKSISPNLPDEPLEVIYVSFQDTRDNQIAQKLSEESVIKNLNIPEKGVFKRGAYPFLLFKQVDGKLMLVAFTKEFMGVVDAIFTLQIS